jgi:hypothetical protein
MLIPDNCSTAVNHSKSDWNTTALNTTYHEMAEHNNVAIIPARVRKPKDKPNVEGSHWNTGFQSPELGCKTARNIQSNTCYIVYRAAQSRLNRSRVYTFAFTSSRQVSYRFAMIAWLVSLNFFRSLTTWLPKKVLPSSRVGS